MMKETLQQMMANVPTPISRAHVEEVVATYFDTHRTLDFERRAKLFADDVVAEEPVGGPPMVGKAALVAFWKAGHEAGWRSTLQLEQIVMGGSEALVIFNAKLSTDKLGSANLKVYENLAFDSNGKIRRLRAFNDGGCIS